VITRLLKSPALRSAIGFGFGGVGFALANILLARSLTPADFGLVTLALSLGQFGLTLGPFGLEIVANRHRPRPNARLAALAFALALGTGALLAAVAWRYYDLSPSLSLIVMGTVVGTATNRIASAFFQGEGRLRPAMVLIQIHNYVLLAIAAAALLVRAPGATALAARSCRVRWRPHRGGRPSRTPCPALHRSPPRRMGLPRRGIGRADPDADRVRWSRAQPRPRTTRR